MTRGTSYHSQKLHLGPCSSAGMWQGTDRHTDGRVATVHFAWLSLMQNVTKQLDSKYVECVCCQNTNTTVHVSQSKRSSLLFVHTCSFNNKWSSSYSVFYAAVQYCVLLNMVDIILCSLLTKIGSSFTRIHYITPKSTS